MLKKFRKVVLNRMLILKLSVCTIISFVCSHMFFNSSEAAALLIFLGLDIAFVSKKSHEVHKKIPVHIYVILIEICLIGIILMIVGKKVVHQDILIIVGAMLCASILSAFVVLHAGKLLEYIRDKLKQNGNK